MQCDVIKHGLPCKDCGWQSKCHVQMMVQQKLLPDLKQIARKFPTWTPEQVLQGAVAAYDVGVDNVTSWQNLDKGTTHNDFSGDIIARAQYLHSLGWDD